MATEEEKNKKEGTTAPGADSTSENQISEQLGVEGTEEKDLLQLVLESNQAVIDSNNAVIAAIEAFNENAKDVVSDILVAAKGGKSEIANKPKAIEVSINKKATYVVAKGKKFHSSVSGSIVKEGTVLNGLETERLKSLIAQGIAVEKTEDLED